MNKSLKAYLCTKAEINAEERSVVAYITTDHVDRDKEVVVPKGIDFEAFRKNPVVLWAHDYALPPIGKNLWIKFDDFGIRAKTQFADTERGREVFSLYQAGFLNAFSIGFLPDFKQCSEPTEEEVRARPDWAGARCILRKIELVEYSAVPVPCNREALVRAIKAKGLMLSDDFRKELDLVETPTPPAIEPPPPAPVEKTEQPVSERLAFRAMRRSLDRALMQLTSGDDFQKQIGELVAKQALERLDVARGRV